MRLEGGNCFRSGGGSKYGWSFSTFTIIIAQKSIGYDMLYLSMSGGNGEHLKPERVRQDVRAGPDEEVAAQRADATTPPAAGQIKSRPSDSSTRTAKERRWTGETPQRHVVLPGAEVRHTPGRSSERMA